jgi:peptidoglycan biosynthesis protein MviN/MurJ (putative lipid II flippase)
MRFLKARDENGELSVGKVIGVVILVIIGLLMLPIVQDAVTSAEENATSSSAETLIGMITIFYVLGLVLAAVMWVVHETKGFGK